MKIKCDICKKEINSKSMRLFKGKVLCFPCFRKKRINMPPYQAYLPKHPIKMVASISLTKEQAKLLKRRLKQLFPEKYKKFKYSGMSTYLKILLLSDLDVWSKNG